MLQSIEAIEVVKTALSDVSSSVGVTNQFYGTATGKKYHVVDCPYCKGKTVRPISAKMMKHLKLEPCKCIEKKKLDNNAVTAFVDESIHQVQWDEEGKAGKVCSFSYIICRGRLESEEEITDKNTITRGVSMAKSGIKTDDISKAAIAHVLAYLLAECNFKGQVYIYSDNETAVNSWTKQAKGLRLAMLFEGVIVKHISRSVNTKADKLGRERIILNIPKETYRQIVGKVKAYDRIQVEKAKVVSVATEASTTVTISKFEIIKGCIKNLFRLPA